MYGGGPAFCNVTGTSLLENVVLRNIHVTRVNTVYDIVGLDNGAALPSIRELTFENVTVSDFHSLGKCKNADVLTKGIVSPPLPPCTTSENADKSMVLV